MLESLKEFKKLNNEQLTKVIGGLDYCTNKYGNTKVATSNNSDVANNPNDWIGTSDDGGGCPELPPSDSTSTKA